MESSQSARARLATIKLLNNFPWAEEKTELLYDNFLFPLKYFRTKWRGGTRGPTALILEMRADYCPVSVAGTGNVFKIVSKYRFNLACCLLAIFQTEPTRP